jgi:hypothetical protein
MRAWIQILRDLGQHGLWSMVLSQPLPFTITWRLQSPALLLLHQVASLLNQGRSEQVTAMTQDGARAIPREAETLQRWLALWSIASPKPASRLRGTLRPLQAEQLLPGHEQVRQRAGDHEPMSVLGQAAVIGGRPSPAFEYPGSIRAHSSGPAPPGRSRRGIAITASSWCTFRTPCRPA